MVGRDTRRTDAGSVLRLENAAEILRRSSSPGPLSAPLGIGLDGEAAWLDLGDRRRRHLIVEGDAAASGETLRSVVAGLTLSARPVELQVVGIDPSGRELTWIDGLPHALSETAVSGEAIAVTLRWLRSELEARRREGRAWPALLVVIHEAQAVTVQAGRGSLRILRRLLTEGGEAGLHVAVGAAPRSRLASRLSCVERVQARLMSDRLRLRVDRKPGEFHLAPLPVVEIDGLRGWQVGGRRCRSKTASWAQGAVWG